jgi:hypothetical protein
MIAAAAAYCGLHAACSCKTADSEPAAAAARVFVAWICSCALALLGLLRSLLAQGQELVVARIVALLWSRATCT